MINNVFYTDTSFFLNPEIFNFYLNEAGSYRKNKIEKLKTKGKENSIAVEFLLQKALEQAGLSFSQKDREIEINSWGKPYLVNHKEIFFNLSHTKNRALCILSDRECGCDVEFINQNKFNIDIVRRFFSQKEIESIENCQTDKKADLFFDFWTRKEAFGKMMGFGVNQIIKEKTDFSDLQTFEKNNNCFFKIYSVEDEYKYTVCSKNNFFPDKMTFLKPEI